MPDLHIQREHGLGLAQARELAFRWAQTAEKKLDMQCVYEEGKAGDVVSFKRPGVNGELHVLADRFELRARLGLMLGLLKGRIESEIVKNLDMLLASDEPLQAFDQAVAQAAARKRSHRKSAS